ncbi:hypothetical protein I6G56_00495 (plasmid) [Burkholderia humptydooensis]|uniref:Uncharacterized protein n=1 Tax=Burkholderia humptydooensis TaxID=430531 RepID=A0A7U4STB7_9BURK|nr:MULTISPECIES: hypothetical protein [Burkholderia]AJY38112.1 hypothetical protein BW21_6140 [Burkholderia sp. 2002721687]ALX44586.1 hypothetical protein AQ610_18740 [Burkholderia humptydooensis]QPS42030.1 hypothetical protein I6G56_00495 [Burkholderia humptydooensis]
MLNNPRQTFDDIVAKVRALESEHPDRVVMLHQAPPNIAVSSGNRGPLLIKAVSQRVSLHPDDTIRFNV